MTDTDHGYRLEDFVAGQLSEAEEFALIEHLADCADCEAAVERLWTSTEPGQTLPHVPDAELEVASRVESNLFRRIHRADLGGQFVKLGTQNFLNLIIALVRPFTGGIRSSSIKRR